MKRVWEAVPIIYFFFARSISTWICLKIMLLPFLILLTIWTSEFPWEVIQWIGFDFDSNSCFISSKSEMLIKIQSIPRNTRRNFSMRFPKLFFNSAIFWNIPGGYCKNKSFLAWHFNLLVVTCPKLLQCRVSLTDIYIFRVNNKNI